jgi:hypothetical protein
MLDGLIAETRAFLDDVNSCSGRPQLLAILKLQVAVLMACKARAAALCFPSGRTQITNPSIFHIGQSSYYRLSTLARVEPALNRLSPIQHCHGKNLLDFLTVGTGDKRVLSALSEYQSFSNTTREKWFFKFVQLPLRDLALEISSSLVERPHGRKQTVDLIFSFTQELRNGLNRPECFFIGDEDPVAAPELQTPVVFLTERAVIRRDDCIQDDLAITVPDSFACC